MLSNAAQCLPPLLPLRSMVTGEALHQPAGLPVRHNTQLRTSPNIHCLHVIGTWCRTHPPTQPAASLRGAVHTGAAVHVRRKALTALPPQGLGAGVDDCEYLNLCLAQGGFGPPGKGSKDNSPALI